MSLMRENEPQRRGKEGWHPSLGLRHSSRIKRVFEFVEKNPYHYGVCGAGLK